mgnify:CR=1 FL=1
MKIKEIFMNVKERKEYTSYEDYILKEAHESCDKRTNNIFLVLETYA